MPVGRFAPSPTGRLHIGSLVAALGSYIFARRTGGRWLLRMEDLDRPRVVPGAADDIMRTLESLGFCWDGGVMYQSARGDAYEAAFSTLQRGGHLFPCACSRAEIARTATAPHDHEGELVYPGRCRDGLQPGKRASAYRVKVPQGPMHFSDLVQGLCSYDLSLLCGDFVVRRADGIFAYQLAVVVDDAEQGVSQVVRGADLLSSTPRQMLLQRMLGYPTPVYAHLPLVTGPDGGKLSKRDTSISCADGTVSSRDGWRLLAAALKCLGSLLPQALMGAPCPVILDWAVTHLDPAAIPRGPCPAPLPISSTGGG